MAFRVLKPGLLSLIQDRGRFGFQHQGLTTGGVLDEYAANWANRLLGNDLAAPVIEITLGNMQLEAMKDTVVVLTGAVMPVFLNDQPVAQWQLLMISAGDILRLGWASSGQRSYLAVWGGFQVAPVFGSVSTVVREHVGGLVGAAIKVNDILPYRPCQPFSMTGALHHGAPKSAIPDYDQSIQIRVIQGNQISQFSAEDQAVFFAGVYRLTADSDRMGYRLSGPAIHYDGPGLLSEGIAYGAIQIPPDGQPIIMLKDRQTIGGYPKIGAVLPLDAYRLSQMKTGGSVHFAPISLDQAQSLMTEFHQFFDAPSGSPLKTIKG